MKGRLKKILLAGSLLSVLAFGLAIVVIWYAKYTVAYGEKNGSENYTVYGYRLEQYYFWNSMRLTIWNMHRLNKGITSVYEIPDVTADKVVEERWLKNESAIYLDVQFKQDDSLITTRHGRMLYDYRRAEIYTSGLFWRLWARGYEGDNSMSQEEFDSILNRLEP